MVWFGVFYVFIFKIPTCLWLHIHLSVVNFSYFFLLWSLHTLFLCFKYLDSTIFLRVYFGSALYYAFYLQISYYLGPSYSHTRTPCLHSLLLLFSVLEISFYLSNIVSAIFTRVFIWLSQSYSLSSKTLRFRLTYKSNLIIYSRTRALSRPFFLHLITSERPYVKVV